MRSRRYKKKHVTLSILLLALVSCGNAMVIKETETAHPILQVEVMAVPSEGVVDILTGDVFAKKKDANKYIRVQPTYTIGFGDMLELRKDASVKIDFKDGTSVKIGPVEKDTWITFEKSGTTNELREK